jgi:hypothetical protein
LGFGEKYAFSTGSCSRRVVAVALGFAFAFPCFWGIVDLRRHHIFSNALEFGSDNGFLCRPSDRGKIEFCQLLLRDLETLEPGTCEESVEIFGNQEQEEEEEEEEEKK